MATEPVVKEHRSKFNVFIILLATLGSISYGYSSCIIATTLGQPSFITYMKLDLYSNAVQLIGAINGLYQAGGLLGTLYVGLTGDRLGRRWAIFSASAITVVGGALQTGSVHVGMFMAARFITGLGIGALVTLIPLWQSEVAPPRTRGFLVGLHGVFILVGYSSASWVGVGFYFVNAEGSQFRPPLALQILPPLLLACAILYMPESPRWLMERDRGEECLAILRKIHADASDPHGEFAQREYNQIRQQITYEKALPTSWGSILEIPSYRKRLFVGFGCMFFAQCTGTQVINNYGPLLYKNLGFSTANALIIQAGWITWGIIGNFINAVLLDRVGRKWLMSTVSSKILMARGDTDMTGGMVGCAVSLLLEIIMLALYQDTGDRAGNSAAVFFLFLHIGFYASSLDASTYVYASEIWPTHLRARGCAISVSGLFVSSLILLCAASDAFAAIGWRYYLVFLSMTVIGAVFFALVFPETRHKPLEEIAAAFGDEVVDYSLEASTDKDAELSEGIHPVPVRGYKAEIIKV
ncbi:hypothetical protein LTR84_011652 [Exophiala bonariae]|uniref:Major facilitator superfamily (MFS) profile domain-containing protein n=1 Tax=Exophiala bonariae TaxID=1690606 RepID=A0AAV9NJ20_9EURO|nr:hypothetical protein LTR84_011652 [Exophiala bonariae]